MIQLDLNYLKSISGGDEEFVKTFLRMVMGSSFSEMEALKTQAELALWKELASTAHKMKAPIQMLGVTEASNVIAEIEHIGRTQTGTEDAVTKTHQLAEMIRLMAVEIQLYLD